MRQARFVSTASNTGGRNEFEIATGSTVFPLGIRYCLVDVICVGITQPAMVAACSWDRIHSIIISRSHRRMLTLPAFEGLFTGCGEPTSGYLFTRVFWTDSELFFNDRRVANLYVSVYVHKIRV
ncbi:hypothetical protein BaRGS_00032566 [Batillaria attramentaria]|uniref:Uncharacterized protein n=1 Tax=Batillaria attramentaria TaxID=370345 RepID=A0ABD0JMN6_9CAEN